MGLRTLLKRTIRVIFRILLYTFILCLPVTFFPIIAGIEGAITFHVWNLRQGTDNTNAFLFEAEQWNFRNYYNMPSSGLSIHEFFDDRPPFHIPQVTSFDWLQKLRVVQPLEFDTVRDESVGVDKLACLQGLVRDASISCDEPKGKAEKLKSKYWIYVTEFPEYRGDAWDKAFEDIIKELYVKPLTDDTGIYHLDCIQSGFLCGVWGVKAPSLVHVTIEDKSMAELEVESLASQGEDSEEQDADWMSGLLTPNFTYSSPLNVLYPATIRVIELPLEDEIASSLLSRATLPTPSQQLRTLLLDPDQEALISHFDSYDTMQQILRRFQEHHDELVEKRGTYHFYFTELDKWWSNTVLEPIFGKEFTGNDGFMTMVQGITFTIFVVVGAAVVVPITIVKEVYRWYIGVGWDGQPLDQTVPSDMFGNGADSGSGFGLPVGSNFMVDMFAGFMDFIGRNISDEAREKVAQAFVDVI